MKTHSTQTVFSARTRNGWLISIFLLGLLCLGTTPLKAQQWVIGAGTTTNSSTTYPTPYGAWFSGQRAEYLYRASELIAAGMTAGPIHQIAFNVTSQNGAGNHNAYSIQIANTTTTNLTTWQTVPTTYFSTANYIPVLGWNTHTLSAPFIWNGTDNIIVEICHWNGTSTFTNNASVQSTAVTSAAIAYWADNGGPFCGNNSLSPTSHSTRPNAQFTRLLPCVSQPSAGTISPSGIQSVCPGSIATITTTGSTVAANLVYQWMQSTNGGTTWVPVVGGSGGATSRYTTGAITANIMYHLVIFCTNTGQSDSSGNVTYNVTSAPVYAPLPFSESFENWTSRCATNDIPSTSWTNIPFTGNTSWRRDDDGSSASWTTPAGGAITPIAKVGAHSARFHAYSAASGNVSTAGQLSMYVNCSATTGNKELQFYSHRDPNASFPQDSLIVDTSTNGGATFGVLARFGAGGSTWDFHSITFPSTSATTVIRFRAWQNYNCTGCGYPDIYLDGVKVLPPCAGKPIAGSINPVTPCSGQNFTLSLSGTTASAGLSYQWQFLPAGSTGPWQALAGGTIAAPTANITVPTYFRAIVACTNGGPADIDTSAPFLANLASFYYCYCGTSVSNPNFPYVNISNVTVKTQPANVVLLNNGTALPTLNNPGFSPTGYTDWRYTVAAPTFIRDSTYKLTVAEASYNTVFLNGYTTAWIDYDHDGVFQPSERIMINVAVLSSTIPNVSANFTIPSNAGIGLTGMRVLMSTTSSTTLSPCGNIGAYGEVEDYIVYLDYPPCTGPVNAGTAWISDTAVCPGYSIDLGDTTYEKQRTNIARMWQYTDNGGVVWFNIAGSANKDTVNNVVVTGASSYRLRTICTRTGDTTYSNVLNVSIPDPVRCYPYSEAIGGPNSDSTDIGAFVIGSFVNPNPANPAGPHLYNPLAVRRRTDYTLMPGIELFADSTYKLSIFQTMLRGNHSDALVSVFMDFNNDLQYNVGTAVPPFSNELVFQGQTRFDSFYLDTKIKMPSAVIPNVLTGMRVVINSDLNPSHPGNIGAGGFVSGEVEDYVVIFRRAALGTPPVNLLQNLSLYPNPTEGKFTVLCDAGKNVAHLDVVVSTITGQQVERKSFDNVGTKFTTTLDLSTQAKGIYFVEVRADGEKITRKLIIR